jgi:hypothetical protein
MVFNTFAQWKKCEKVISDPLYSVSICDSLNILAAGGDGTVIRTTDGGEKWTIDTLPTIHNIHQIITINKEIALAITRWGGIFRTTDSGKKWNKVNDLDLGGDNLVDDGLNSSVLYGVRNNFELFKSIDSGSNWTLVSRIPTNYPLYSLKFIDDNIGYVCGANGILLKTTDSGITWEKIARGLTSNTYRDLVFIRDSIYLIGYDVSARSSIYSTVIGQDNWKLVSELGYPGIFTLTNSGKLWWITAEKEMFRLEDLTLKITKQYEIIDENIISVKWYGTSGIGFLVTTSGEVYKTNNHGIGDCTLEIIKSPLNTNGTIGGSSVFKVSSNDSDSKIQWQTKVSGLEWINLQNNNTYSNVNSDSLIVSNITVNNHNQLFRAIVNNNLCKDTSETATLTVLDTCVNKLYDTVKVTVADTLIIKTKVTGIQENKYYTFLIYPNPTSTQVIIDCGDNTEVSAYSYTITNSLGQEKLTSKFTSRYQQIDISGIGGTGLYIITIKDSNNTVLETRKLLIQ